MTEDVELPLDAFHPSDEDARVKIGRAEPAPPFLTEPVSVSLTTTSKEDLIAAARKLVRLGRPGYQITLYGGEPTLHPNFLDLLGYFASCGAPVSLRVYTNGSSPAALFERTVQTIGTMPFGIIFSLHHEYANL